MSLRLIEVTAKAGHLDTLRAIADKDAVATCRVSTSEEGGCALTILAGSQNRQSMLDQMQTYLGTSDGWRIVVLPVEAAVPPLERDKKSEAG